MPIYAYKCASCGHQQDVLQKISDDPLTVCPQCNQASYAKQVTAAGFQLKGSGWYVTDFRDNGAKKDSKAADKAGEKAGENAGDKAGDKATDGKSAEAKPADTSAAAKPDSAAGTAASTASSSSTTPGTSTPSGGGTPPTP